MNKEKPIITVAISTTAMEKISELKYLLGVRTVGETVIKAIADLHGKVVKQTSEAVIARVRQQVAKTKLEMKHLRDTRKAAKLERVKQLILR